MNTLAAATPGVPPRVNAVVAIAGFVEDRVIEVDVTADTQYVVPAVIPVIEPTAVNLTVEPGRIGRSPFAKFVRAETVNVEPETLLIVGVTVDSKSLFLIRVFVEEAVLDSVTVLVDNEAGTKVAALPVGPLRIKKLSVSLYGLAE